MQLPNPDVILKEKVKSMSAASLIFEIADIYESGNQEHIDLLKYVMNQLDVSD